jgi:hypothetical protein
MSPSRTNSLFAAVGLSAATALGVLVAVRAPGARADGPPLPTLPATVPVDPSTPPTLPVTVPTLPPPVSTTTSTGASGGDPAPASPGGDATQTATPAAGARGANDLPAGAVRLADGTISIPPASAVRPLRLVAMRVQPTAVRRPAQRLVASLRVTDSRGYVVRALLVRVASDPAGRVGRTAARTALNGSVKLALRTTQLLPLRASARLRLIFVGAGARRLLSVPVQPGT